MSSENRAVARSPPNVSWSTRKTNSESWMTWPEQSDNEEFDFSFEVEYLPQESATTPETSSSVTSQKTFSVSPPSYSVQEDSKGNLMNHDLNVQWPERPPKGRYSLDEYLKRRNQFENDRQFKRRMHKAHSIKEDTESTQGPNEVAALFVGARKTSAVVKMLRPTNFLLYYQYPKRMKELSDVPFSLPLVLTYMSSGGEVHNFHVNRITVGDSLAWQVDVGGSEIQPCFRSITALLQYYSRYSLKRDGVV